jgi:hypothetical protein
MKKYFVVPILVLTASLLAGCNPASLLGPIRIGSDPLGLESQEINMPLTAKLNAAALSAQTVNGTGNKTFTFANIDNSSFAAVGNPVKLAQLVGIKEVNLVTTDVNQPACNVATGFTASVKINTLKLEVTDDSGQKFGASTTGTFDISKTATGYEIKNVSSMTLPLTGSFSVLTSGGLNTGRLEFNVDLTGTPADPSNCTIKIKLKGIDATVSF